jgi:hypothetical protein
MVLASQYDQSRFLKAADLAAEKKFRIKKVTEELVGIGADQEKKLVIWFTNDERGLVLNRVNNRAIRADYGDAVDGWVSKIVIVFPTTADFRGRMVPALRVRIPPPKQPATATPASPQPVSSGNGATVAAKPAAPSVDSELEPDPKKSLSEELDDEIPF